MRHIVLPQAFRITIPPFANYFITLVQDSALLSVIGGVIELQQFTSSYANPYRRNQRESSFMSLGRFCSSVSAIPLPC